MCRALDPSSCWESLGCHGIGESDVRMAGLQEMEYEHKYDLESASDQIGCSEQGTQSIALLESKEESSRVKLASILVLFRCLLESITAE